MLRTLFVAFRGGFLYGSLGYATVISLLHVIHNQVGSLRDALLTYALCSLLYGLWAAVFFSFAATLAWRLGRRLVPEERLARGLLGGTILFNLVFWELFFLYGLTYDQAPWQPRGAPGMAAGLAACAAAVALAVVAVSFAVFRLWWAARRRGRLAWWAAGLGIAGFSLHLALSLSMPAPAAAAARPKAFPVPRQETGLSVAVVGLDGADWRVARPLMDEGRLPAFSALAAEGASGDLATIHDSNSAVIWASIYSGARPEVHQVLDFYRLRVLGMQGPGIFPVHRTFFKELTDLAAKAGVVEQIPVDRFAHRVPPWWEIADAAGLSIGVVDGYFYSFPALAPARKESWFLSYGLDAFAAIASQRAGLLAQPRELFRQVRPHLEGGDFYWQSATLLDLVAARGQPRLLNLYTHEPDTGQHQSWRFFEPRWYLRSRRGDPRGDHIPGLYRDFDAFLGRLRTTLAPGTVIFVVSDHGHSPTMVHSMDTQHRHGPPGILLAAGGPVRPGVELRDATIYDLYPTVLHLLGLPVPEDAAGKVLVDALDPAWAAAHPLRTIPSYRPLGYSPGLPAVGRDRIMNEREIDRIRALGYIF